jgi:hypothetical protein
MTDTAKRSATLNAKGVRSIDPADVITQAEKGTN